MFSILLDTNGYINMFKGFEDVKNEIINADIVYMSTIVIGELYTGFYRSPNFEKQRGEFDNFISSSDIQVLPVDFETSIIFGEIKSKLMKIGSNIPINDTWIAAQCIQKGTKLITYDKDFLKVPGLRIWNQLY